MRPGGWRDYLRRQKKAYEIFADYAPVYLIEFQQMKNSCDREVWQTEIRRFKDKIEAITGNTVTAEKLQQATKIVNDRRRALQRLNQLRERLAGAHFRADVLLINQVSFYDDPIRFTGSDQPAL